MSNERATGAAPPEEPGDLPRPDDTAVLRRAGREGGPWLTALAVTALVLAAAETAVPAALGRAVDSVVGEARGSWFAAFGLLVALLVICDALDDVAVGQVTARSTAWLRGSLLRHLLAVGPRATSRLSAGEIVTRLGGNAADAGRIAPDLIRAVANLIPAVGGTVALALIDPWLCATFLIGMPALVVLVRAFARQASDAAKRYLAVQGRIAGRLGDALSGARTIAAAGTTEKEAARVLAELPELHAHGMALWQTHTRMSAQQALVPALLEIAVLGVAGARLAAGRITPGEMVAAVQYVALATTLGGAVTSVARLVAARAGAARAADILNEPPVAFGTDRLPSGSGQLEFRGVRVAAGGRAVFDGLDLVIPAGALVAVVGPSGSGKSLLAALAGRLVDPDEGEVLLDGVPLSRLARSELRRAVSYGFERPVLIGETVAGAIAFGQDRTGPHAVAAAARSARADDFIRRLPDGYDTPLAAAPMSGGEAQRVGLARTFAHAGRVVVLDDVAASLDTVTEHHIAEVLTAEFAGRTRLVVAHRASTAARADFVVWLERGRARAVAPHDTLWADPGYRALFEPDDDSDHPSAVVVGEGGSS